MEKNLEEEIDDFLREEYYDRIIDIARKGGESLIIDYEKLSLFDPDIAHRLLKRPEKILKTIKEQVKKIDFLQKELELNIRVNNLPDDRKVRVRHIRSKHIGKLIAVEGIIRQTSDVRPEAASVIFECPSCGRKIEVKQKKKKLMRPTRCKCGRKGNFLMKEKKLVDTQRLVLEESPGTLKGGEQPKRIPIYIKEDLVSPEMERRVCPGSRIIVYGRVEEVPLTTRRGAKSKRYELKMIGNYIKPKEQEFKKLEIGEKDKRKIESIADAPDAYEKLIDSIAPTISGYRVIKEAILLELFGGVRKVRSDGTVSRGDIHQLLVGDPGTGKCVSPQTNIALSDGRIKKIKDIIDPELEEEGKKVKKKKLISTDYSLNISKENSIAVSKRYYTGRLYEIVTSSGRKIKVTKKHPLFAFNGGDIKKKPAESIEKGDRLAIVKKLPIKGEKQGLPEFRPSSREKDIKLPNKTNPDFLEFIGYYLSEGIIDKNEIRITNFSSRIQKRLKRLSKKLFGIKAKKNSSGDLRFFSSALCRFFKRIGLKTGAEKKGVPEKLMKCKNKEIAKLLRGIFDGDGSVSKKDRNITLNSKSKELVEGVQHLLLRFGIFSSIHPTWKKAQGWEKKKKYYRLRISNYENLKRFKENIGFVHPKKKGRLKERLTKKRIKCYERYRENKFPVGEKLLKIRRLVNFPVPRGSKTYSKQRLVKITNKKRILEYLNEFEERADKILEANLPKEPKKFWNSVRKIKKLTNEPFSSFCSSAAKHYINLKPKKRINLIKKARAYNKLKVGETTKSQVAGLTSQTTALRWKKGTCKPSLNILKETEKTREKLKKCLEKAKMKARQAKAEIERLRHIINLNIAWDVVEKVKEKEVSKFPVYDFQMLGAPTFMANGFVSHNSSLLRYISKLAPKATYVTGKGTTTAGLTASVVRSEIGEGWNLEAGALVLSSGGICCIDEIDKMSSKDKVGMNEALSEQTVTIAKANIRATLKAQTTVLGAANPEFGRFDPYTPLAEQIDLPPTLINRFDLIFPIRDIPKKERDSRIANHILRMNKEPKKEISKIEPSLFRKYVAYAKQVRPELTEEAMGEIREFYVDLRNQKTVSSGEEDVKPIPISARQLQALIRLSEASARVRLDDWVRERDAKRAIRLLKYSLGKVGVSPETGEIDIDRVMTGISTSQRSRIMRIRDVLKSLEKKVGEQIPISEILDRAEDIGINRDKCEEVLDKMEREGEIFEPRRGVIKRVKS